MSARDTSPSIRAVLSIEGRVQGVGFRPFLYRLAVEHNLRGCVANSASGVEVEIEGSQQCVDRFLSDLAQRQPPLAEITNLTHSLADPVGHPSFVIDPSRNDGHRTALISPDVAVCDDCLAELFDPENRRYRYPLINCTNCGPRFTIISSVPYDRPGTSMACFAMCTACRSEYDDPLDRRFHAQPNACPECGPQVWLVTGETETSRAQSGTKAIDAAVGLLREGAVVAIKGLGGFHLACDATNERAVAILRERKNRDEKPFALMVPDLQTARELCHIDSDAESLLTSRKRPITLLPRRTSGAVADNVAPGNNSLGLMLPYTPLHHLLLSDEHRKARFLALVMTSGNVSEEPIVIGNREARRRLNGLADAFLLHDRDILARADDSVVRPHRVTGSLQPALRKSQESGTILRRSRGHVPAPVFLDRDVGEVLAVGGQLKNTIAVSFGKAVFLSQHIGDLSNIEAVECHRQAIAHLQQVLGVRPAVVAHDLHPDYASTRFARQLENVQLVAVQHHHAHVAACMAEHNLDGPVIGVALDGTGYGTDGKVWGGEILIADYGSFERVAHLREVRMPGNEQAIRQPWRMALSYLDAAFGEELWKLPIQFVRELNQRDAELLLHASRQGVNSPWTSSCGRLFDAVAAIVGIRCTNTYEGQAALELELRAEIEPAETDHWQLQRMAQVEPGRAPAVIDSTELIRAVVDDVIDGVAPNIISRRFHRTLVRMIGDVVIDLSAAHRLPRVVLTGGCFQNEMLRLGLIDALDRSGLEVLTHHSVPTNDGGLALGQIAVASTVAGTTKADRL